MEKAEKSSLTRSITDFVSFTCTCNAHVICEEEKQVVFDGGSILYLILWEKNVSWQDTGLKYSSYVFQILEVVVLFLMA